jgi:beta-lactamase superfamily II metal-dependent hydrolase
VLLGTYLAVVETKGEWLRVETRSEGPGGWVHKDDVRTNPGLKIFYVDVGQGDGAIIESPEGLVLIDGGPAGNLYAFMRSRYRKIIDEEGSVKIKAMVVSHPDQDHYEGFIKVLTDPKFEIETIYHNGIIRYPDKNLPPHLTFDLGDLKTRTVDGQIEHVLVETIDTLDDVRAMIASGHHVTPSGGKTTFHKFWAAALDAHDAGRLGSASALTIRDKTLPGFRKKEADKLYIEVLGPVPTRQTGALEYVTFPDAESVVVTRTDPTDEAEIPKESSSHTRNGHSIVLKLWYGDHSFLFGGDLNIPAQLHLMKHYGANNPFECDIAKACHHGSSDFHVEFLKLVRPHANVVSSGDNKSFDHPVADAVGALARHTRGDHPLFFSTELARAVSGENIHYGLVNARSNGTVLTMAQMKEQHTGSSDVWDSFTLPWRGRFHEVLDG